MEERLKEEVEGDEWEGMIMGVLPSMYASASLCEGVKRRVCGLMEWSIHLSCARERMEDRECGGGG